MNKTLKIDGMMCQRCVAHVKKAVEEVEGMLAVDVNLKKKQAVVSIQENVQDVVLIQAVTDAGYEVKSVK